MSFIGFLGLYYLESEKREDGNVIINTKSKAVLLLFSVCNKYMGVY